MGRISRSAQFSYSLTLSSTSVESRSDYTLGDAFLSPFWLFLPLSPLMNVNPISSCTHSSVHCGLTFHMLALRSTLCFLFKTSKVECLYIQVYACICKYIESWHSEVSLSWILNLWTWGPRVGKNRWDWLKGLKIKVTGGPECAHKSSHDRLWKTWYHMMWYQSQRLCCWLWEWTDRPQNMKCSTRGENGGKWICPT